MIEKLKKKNDELPEWLDDIADQSIVEDVKNLITHIAKRESELSELKDWSNGLFEIIKFFLPVCPSKQRKMLEIAIKKGKELRVNKITELERLQAENERLKDENNLLKKGRDKKKR